MPMLCVLIFAAIAAATPPSLHHAIAPHPRATAVERPRATAVDPPRLSWGYRSRPTDLRHLAADAPSAASPARRRDAIVAR